MVTCSNAQREEPKMVSKFARVIGLSAGGLLSLAAVAAGAPSGLDLLRSAASETSKVVGTSLTVDVLPVAKSAGFAFVEGDRILISDQAMAMVQTPQEARALLSLAIAYQDFQFGPRPRHHAGTLEKVISFPMLIIAENAASNRNENASSGNNGPLSAPEIQEERIKRGKLRAAYAVDLNAKSGSCSGPMVDLLQRMQRGARGGGMTAARNQPAGFARQVLKDLGSTVYPPNRSCE
jgi:hypothetical protein